MKCPHCDGKIWDNRVEKASGKRSKKYPDFKCSNRDCTGGTDGGPWVGYGDKGAAECGAGAESSKAGGSAAPGSGGRRSVGHTWATLYVTAERCWKMAGLVTGSITADGEVKPDHPSRASVFATLFIAAKDEGLLAGKPKAAAAPAKPAPPPPPPPPPPPADDSFDDDDDLPF